jgi:hypothetical protein
MNFLKVWTELDGGKFKSLPAKVVSKNTKGVFTIKYLSHTNKRTISGKRIYMYENETYEITEESIVQQVESELTLGFEELTSSPGHFIKFDFRDDMDDDADQEDEDYVPGTSSCGEDDGEDSSDWSSSDYIDEDASGEENEDTDNDDGQESDFYEYGD